MNYTIRKRAIQGLSAVVCRQRTELWLHFRILASSAPVYWLSVDVMSTLCRFSLNCVSTYCYYTRRLRRIPRVVTR